MELTYDLCKVHKRRSGISLGMNYKGCADNSEWSEHNKNENVIHFECERIDVAHALNYFKQTYRSKLTAVQEKNPRIQLILYLHVRILHIWTWSFHISSLSCKNEITYHQPPDIKMTGGNLFRPYLIWPSSGRGRQILSYFVPKIYS